MTRLEKEEQRLQEKRRGSGSGSPRARLDQQELLQNRPPRLEFYYQTSSPVESILLAKK
jgi:hypothetical protein